MVYPAVPVSGVAPLLNELVATLPDVDGAVLLSPDGLVLGSSDDVDPGFADYLSAASAGLQSLGNAVGRQAGARAVHQVIVEMEYALLVVTPVGPVAILAVVLDGTPDFTTIGAQIAEFAERVGERLGPYASKPDMASAK